MGNYPFITITIYHTCLLFKTRKGGLLIVMGTKFLGEDLDPAKRRKINIKKTAQWGV